MKKEKQKIKLFVIVEWVMAVAFCLPYILSARFTVFWADDFSHYLGMEEMPGTLLIEKAWQYMLNIYKIWQGTYFAIFLQSILSPMRYGGVTWLRCISIANILLFFISLYFALRMLFRYLGLEAKHTITAFLLVVIPLFSYGQYTEILYWLSGQCSYSFPVSLAFLGIGLLFCKRKSAMGIITYVLSLVCLFLAVGGSLEVAGIVTYILLVLLVFDYWKNRKKNFFMMEAFVVALVGSLINAMAPGNFVRHKMIDARSLNFVKTLFIAGKAPLQEFSKYFIGGGTTFLLFAVIIFFLGLYWKGSIDVKAGRCVILACVMVPVVTAYPVIMGYSMQAAWLPNRAMFILDLFSIISLEIIMFLLGYELKAVLREEKEKKFAAMLSTVAVILFVCNHSVALQESFPCLIVDGLAGGSLRDSADAITNMYEQVQTSTEEDVVVLCPSIVWWFNVSPFSEDPTDWRNACVAQYFGKSSVAFPKE